MNPCSPSGTRPVKMPTTHAASTANQTPLQLNAVHTSSAAGSKDALRVGIYVDGERVHVLDLSILLPGMFMAAYGDYLISRKEFLLS